MFKSKIFKILTLVFIVLALSAATFLGWWTTAPPSRTCASCHEINSSYMTWKESGHREMACKECHGSALSNGLHSLREKLGMVTTHISGGNVDDLRMNESQYLETLDRCANCHRSQFALWLSGGHSATYSAIFLDSVHNHTEQLNYDCLRCHGMFFDGTVEDLVQPLDKAGPWHLAKPEKANDPTIPCFACHQVHKEGLPSQRPDYSNPKQIQRNRVVEAAIPAFYNRSDKMYFDATVLPQAKVWDGDSLITGSGDVRQNLCSQCHAPNGMKHAGSSDDQTPRGVHQGLSCMVCHKNHSNDARSSCNLCHPHISNCGLDVKTMNTTYFDSKSPNDIHFVDCTDCHKDKLKIGKK